MRTLDATALRLPEASRAGASPNNKPNQPGGQQQRVAIASGDGSIDRFTWSADEPTGALDSRTTLYDAIYELNAVVSSLLW